MPSQLLKILVSLVVVGGGVFYLMKYTSGAATLEYYKHVDEVMPELAKWEGKPLQLHGYVVPGSIQKRLNKESGRLEYKFKEVNCGKEIEVFYAGVVPDTFKDGAEVVTKGQLDGRSFHCTEVMAKCPSKYEANAMPNTFCAGGRAN